jgi:anti-sigma B factor antagonist
MSENLPASRGLSIVTEIDGDTVSVALEGELDLAAAGAFEARLLAAEQLGPRRIVIDLGDLRFIDSTGLRLLLQADARAREHERELLVRPGGAAIQKVFEVTGALGILRFEHAGEG